MKFASVVLVAGLALAGSPVIAQSGGGSSGGTAAGGSSGTSSGSSSLGTSTGGRSPGSGTTLSNGVT
jgi:hypothetical protein